MQVLTNTMFPLHVYVDFKKKKKKRAEVLVRTLAAGVCHSDLHLSEGHFSLGGDKKFPFRSPPQRTMMMSCVCPQQQQCHNKKRAGANRTDIFLAGMHCPELWATKT